MMSGEKKTGLVAFRLDPDKKALLDEVALRKDRDCSYILLDLYLEHWRWETNPIQKALMRAEAEGDAGLGITLRPHRAMP